jgi:hypothetical protein
MNNAWNIDQDFSLAMANYCDEVYSKLFPIERIDRLSTKDTPHVLDKHFAIDVILHLKTGLCLTVQEKVRHINEEHWHDFTLEYKSNDQGELGEYFKLACDLYLYAWGETDLGFKRVYVFKPLELKLALIEKQITGVLRTNKVHSTASFLAIPFISFKDNWFIWREIKK